MSTRMGGIEGEARFINDNEGQRLMIHCGVVMDVIRREHTRS